MGQYVAGSYPGSCDRDITLFSRWMGLYMRWFIAGGVCVCGGGGGG